jgi:D-tyrosyl-tRNA(Tyr) deacylase
MAEPQPFFSFQSSPGGCLIYPSNHFVFPQFMRAVVQRVSQAAVTVEGIVAGEIQQGLLVLLGVEVGDSNQDLDYVLRKTLNLRIFDDPEGKMNLSLQEVGGKLLVVSQFTLLGDVRRGNRPSFIQAAPPTEARAMYLEYVERARQAGFVVETGVFQASMEVSLVNQGPVTLLIDSRQL